MDLKSQSDSILPPAQQAGVCLHITSLPGAFGIGSIADSAHLFIDMIAQAGISVWQFLPTGPTAYGDSPYQPLSAFAGNELLIGIEPLLRRGLISGTEAQVLEELPDDHVAYESLIPAKMALLSAAAERFFTTAPGDLQTAYEEFQHQHEERWLHDYALFRVLKTLHGERPWPEWGKDFLHREPAAMQQLVERQRAAIERVKIIQFLYHRQWSKLREYAAAKHISLFADMPIYIALDSADAWAHPEILRIDRDGIPGHVAGVPPDYFSEDGQLWGNPLYDWEFHAASGYRWWTERLRHASAMADLVRVDHFRGFESYWAVPFGSATAKVGQWEPGPGDALFSAMSDALGRLPVVAENLGVITARVEDLRKRHGFPGMNVLQLELGDSEFVLDDIEENSVCYTGTHDNDTTLGWFNGGSNDTRTEVEFLATRENALRLTAGEAATIHHDLIRSAFASKARLAVAPMQDFLGLGSEARLNTPGTTQNNWRWRMLPEHMSQPVIDSMRELIEQSSRLNS